MKLFYKPGACSLATHIVLRELGVPFELDRVDRQTGLTESGQEYAKLNPKGYVPALQLDGGELLTEGAAILQYLADQHPSAKLAPPAGTLERARLQEHLNYIASELHKSFSPLFSKDNSDAVKQAATAKVEKALTLVEHHLADGRPFVLGDQLSVADTYLFTVARWTKPTGIALDRWSHLHKFVDRMAQRPTVQAALQAEGLA